jgi:hypothetical protein
LFYEVARPGGKLCRTGSLQRLCLSRSLARVNGSASGGTETQDFENVTGHRVLPVKLGHPGLTLGRLQNNNEL